MHPAVRELKNIEGRFFATFDTWLGLMLAAFSRDDPAYLKLLEPYGPRVHGKPHAADHFAHALGAIHAEMRQDNERGVIRDHLGEIYEAEGGADKDMAQFFTPMPLCEMMARMTLDDTVPEDARIADPACGSGRMLMACVPLRPRGYFFGVDKDPTCAKMAALNMLWRNVDSDIVWGDCLRLKAHGGWMTHRTALGGVVAPFGPERAQALLEASVGANADMRPSPAAKPVQNSLQETETGVQATIIIPKRGQFEMDV
ncbi:MAG: N-6 DNA methylase [Hyphomicrobiales bacterium]|nr:N-6 DNA methylase [Hyphomicrobiales bacterium]